jgi:hypothetical protein
MHVQEADEEVQKMGGLLPNADEIPTPAGVAPPADTPAVRMPSISSPASPMGMAPGARDTTATVAALPARVSDGGIPSLVEDYPPVSGMFLDFTKYTVNLPTRFLVYPTHSLEENILTQVTIFCIVQISRRVD